MITSRTGCPIASSIAPSRMEKSSPSPAPSCSMRLRGVQHFEPHRVLRVADVPLNPLEQRFDLAEIIFGTDAALHQDVDRRLTDVKVLRALPDEARDLRDGLQCARIPFRYLMHEDFRV